MRILQVFAWAAAIALTSCPISQAKSVTVIASSSGDKQTVTVNGKPVEPGEFDMDDGTHVRYSNRNGPGKACKHSSVRVRSVSTGGDDSMSTVSVHEDSDCSGDHDEEAEHDFDFDRLRSTFSKRRERILRDEDSEFDVGSRGNAHHIHKRASASASSGGVPHRDVLDRKFFDVEDLVRVIGSQDDDEDDDDDEMLPTRRRGPRVGSHEERRDSNSGNGNHGERRHAEVHGDGAHARASTSGNGPHHESASIHRSKGGTHARASASSYSH